MTLLSDEDVLVTHCDSELKVNLTREWVIKHSHPDSIYGYKTYNYSVNLIYYIKSSSPNNIIQSDIRVGHFTTVKLEYDYSSAKVVLIPMSPYCQFLYKELGDEMPDFIDIDKLDLFVINSEGYRI